MAGQPIRPLGVNVGGGRRLQANVFRATIDATHLSPEVHPHRPGFRRGPPSFRSVDIFVSEWDRGDNEMKAQLIIRHAMCFPVLLAESMKFIKDLFWHPDLFFENCRCFEIGF